VEPALHPDVEALACLLGRWSGEGEGHYPTIEPFAYREEISLDHSGKPFLAYRQRTVRVDTGVPAHAEMGYLRGIGRGQVELVIAHPTGVAEVAEGTAEVTADGVVVRLHSTSVTGTTTAKEVLSIERSFAVAGDVLSYDLSMAAVGQPLQHHLHAELLRQA
jgi:hypothetical protein